MRMWLPMIEPTRRDSIEVAVMHACAPDHPKRLIPKSAHDDFMLRLGLLNLRRQWHHFDPGAIGCCQVALSLSELVWCVGQNADFARRNIRPFFNPQPQTMARKTGHAGVICRKDIPHPHTKHFGIERQIVPQFIRGKQNFCQDVRLSHIAILF